MKHIQKGQFTLREEFVCHIIGAICIVAMLAPIFDRFESHSNPSPWLHSSQYVLFIKWTLVAWSMASFYLAFIILKQYFIINNNPIAKINSAAQGYTAIEGIQASLSGKTLVSPASNISCTWYSYTIEEYKSYGSRSSWDVIESGESNEHFTLTDITGQCVVCPEGADIFPTTYRVWYDKSWLLTPKYRYTEKLLMPNTHAYVIGVFRTLSGLTADPNIKVKKDEILSLLKAWKKDYQSLLEKFDTNKDGTIDAEEWEKVVKSAEEQINQKYPTISGENVNSVNVISKDGLMLDQPFVISSLRKKDVANKFYVKFICYIVLFIVSILVPFTLDDWYLTFIL